MRIGFLLVFILTLASCSGNQKKEVKDINDILDSSEREYNAEDNVEDMKSEDSLELFKESLKHSQIKYNIFNI